MIRTVHEATVDSRLLTALNTLGSFTEKERHLQNRHDGMGIRSDSLRLPGCLLQVHWFHRVQDVGLHNLQLIRRKNLRFLQIHLLLFPQMPGGRLISPQNHLQQHRKCSRKSSQRLVQTRLPVARGHTSTPAHLDYVVADAQSPA